MNKNLVIIIVIIAALAVVGFAGLQASKQQPAGTDQSQTNKQTSSPTATAQPEIKTFNVEGTPFSFNPNEIKVNKGDTVRINFTNNEGFHDLTIEGYDMKTKQLQAGQSETIEFVADKEGSFTYYCSVPGHREKGMVGSLIVE